MRDPSSGSPRITRITRITKIIAEYSDTPLANIFPTTSLSDSGLDSLDLVVLAQTLEEEFEVVIADEEWEKAVTVDQICELIEEKLLIKENKENKEKLNVKQV